MKRCIISIILILLIFMSCSVAYAEQQSTQTFILHPGWNAIFLEVQPNPRDPDTVFAWLPEGSSVWTWLERNSKVEFIQNPSEGLWDQPGWHVYDKSGSEISLSNLFAIFANRAYLIKLSGNEDITWTVTGIPSVRKIQWVPNSFNLVGFHINPDAPPSFEAFFSPSSAHAGQAMYHLNRQGKWEFIDKPSVISVQPGESYWVYCQGVSNYQGPLKIDLPMSDGLNYGAALTELSITLHNLSKMSRTVTMMLSSSAIVMTYQEYDSSTGYFTWLPLESMPPRELVSGQKTKIKLAVRREAMAAGLAESVLEITDDKGIRVLVPVSAEKVGP